MQFEQSCYSVGYHINRRICIFYLLIAFLLLFTLFVSLRTTSHSLWFDEAHSSEIAHKGTLKEITHRAMKGRAYPPLYFLMQHVSIKHSNDELGLRLPSVIFGILLLLATSLLGKSLFDHSTGFIAALLLLATPGIFRSFVDANSYSMLAFSVTASTYCLYVAIVSQRTLYWIAFALFSIISLCTHTFAVFHVIGQIIAAFYLSWSLKSDISHKGIVRIMSLINKERRLIICTSSILLAWLIWLFFYFSNKGLTYPINIQKVFSLKTLIYYPALYFGYLSKGSLAQFITWLILQIVGIIWCFFDDRPKFLFLSILIIVPMFLISLAQILLLPYFSFRYGIGMFPLASIISACLFRYLGILGPDKLKRRLKIASLFLILLLYVVTGFVAIFSKNSDLLEIQDWKSAGKYLSSYVSENDVLFFVDSWRYSSLAYYFKTPSKLCLVDNDKQVIGGIRYFLKEQPAGEGKIRQKAFWVVLNSLENRSALIEKIFGNQKIPAEEKSKLLIKSLKENFIMETIDVQHFKRVSIVKFIPKS